MDPKEIKYAFEYVTHKSNYKKIDVIWVCVNILIMFIFLYQIKKGGHCKILLILWILINTGIALFLKRKEKESELEPYSSESLNLKPDFPVDVVYTWAGENTEKENKRVAFNGELKYSLRSVRKNLPWIRNIIIFMNPPRKKPSWFSEDYESFGVHIFDHEEVFTDETRPKDLCADTIELALSEIPGLSENFIYMNDDFFIGKPLPFTHFFNEKGKPLVNDRGQRYKTDITKSKLGIKLPEMETWAPHIPVPMTISSLRAFREEYPDFVNWVQNPFKKEEGKSIFHGCEGCKDVGLPCPCKQLHSSLKNFMLSKGMGVKHPEVKTDVFFGNSLNYFYNGNINLMLGLEKDDLPETFVINDNNVPIVGVDRKTFQNTLSEVLPRIFPEKADFES